MLTALTITSKSPYHSTIVAGLPEETQVMFDGGSFIPEKNTS